MTLHVTTALESGYLRSPAPGSTPCEGLYTLAGVCIPASSAPNRHFVVIAAQTIQLPLLRPPASSAVLTSCFSARSCACCCFSSLRTSGLDRFRHDPQLDPTTLPSATTRPTVAEAKGGPFSAGCFRSTYHRKAALKMARTRSVSASPPPASAVGIGSTHRSWLTDRPGLHRWRETTLEVATTPDSRRWRC